MRPNRAHYKGLFHHKNHQDTSHADSVQTTGEPTFNTQDPSVRTTNNPMHPDMLHNDNVNNSAGNKHHHLSGTGNHNNKNNMNNGQNFYEDNYDNVPRTSGAMMEDNTMMGANNNTMGHNHGLGHNNNGVHDGVGHNGNHSNHHGMAGAGLGAAAGGAAGVAAGKHMHNHNGHGMHHNRGGPIPGVMNNGTTGNAMAGGAGMTGAGAGMGGVGGTAATDPTTMVAEDHNNFPGTNPHSAHSALGANGDGTVFPGRV